MKTVDVWLDGHYWSSFFERHYIQQVCVFCEALKGRILSTFDNLDVEAETIAKAEFDHLASQPANDESGDLSAEAEAAMEAGAEHLQALTAVRQTTLNMAVAVLYHMWEQHLMLFHRRQVLSPTEEDDSSKMNISLLGARLRIVGIELSKLSSWPIIQELALVANTVKHAEGRSAQELRNLRPELFTNPVLKELGWNNATPIPHLYMPLAGEDIYLTKDDLERYKTAVVSFWQEFGAAIQGH